MIKRARPLTVLALSGIAVLLLGAAAPQRSDVTISNTGLGDYVGFHIVVHPDGHASAVDATGKASGELSDQLTSQFFADLRTATKAMQNAKPCAAAADTNGRVGYAAANAAISIAWQGHNWSSLACASDARLAALSSDASAIERALYVQAYRQRPMYVYIGGATGYATGTSGVTYASTTYPSTSGYSTSFGHYGTNPMGGYPSGSYPSGTLPTTSLSGGLPTGSLSGTSPYSSLPTSSLPSGSLPSSSVFTSLPYIGL